MSVPKEGLGPPPVPCAIPVDSLVLFIDIEFFDARADVDKQKPLEVASILSTAMDLTHLWNYSAAVHVPDEEVKAAKDSKLMPPKIFDMHTKSGLLDEVSRSTISMQQVDDAHFQAILGWQNKLGTAVDASVYPGGSSVYKDLDFVKRHMPKTASLLTHQTVDGTTLWLSMKFGWLRFCRFPPKPKPHRAARDVAGSYALVKAFQTQMLHIEATLAYLSMQEEAKQTYAYQEEEEPWLAESEQDPLDPGGFPTLQESADALKRQQAEKKQSKKPVPSAAAPSPLAPSGPG